MPKPKPKTDKRDPAKLWDRLKQNPGLIIAVAGAFGVSATEARAFLEADVPGWVAALIGAGVPLLYAALARARSGLEAVQELITEVRGMRGDIRELKAARESDGETLEDHERRLEKGSERFHDHHRRIETLENIHKDELEAYVEEGRRATGEVKPGGDNAAG